MIAEQTALGRFNRKWPIALPTATHSKWLGGDGQEIRRMSKELDDVTRSLARLLLVVRQSKTDAGAELAITQVVDGLVMALGGIERRLDLLERSRIARLH